MTIPKTIFIEAKEPSEQCDGFDAGMEQALLEAMQGGCGMDELTLAFLEAHEEEQEQQQGQQPHERQAEPVRAKASGSSSNGSATTGSDKSPKKKKSQLGKKLACKILGL